MKLNRSILVLTCAGAMTVLPALAQQSSTPTSSSAAGGSDSSKQAETKQDPEAAKFLKQAMRDNSAEVAMAEVGMRKAQNPELKALCQRLQTDHTQQAAQMRPLAEAHGVSVQQNQPEMEKHLAKLNKLSGREFDEKLTTEVLKDHEKDIARFQKASREINDPQVKQFVDASLPKLQQHLQHAETVAKSVGIDQSVVSSILRRSPYGVGGSSDTNSSLSGSGTGSDRKTSQGAAANDLQQPDSAHQK